MLFLYILYYFGKSKLVIRFIISQYMAAILGTMLFHLQHQVNIGYWKKIKEDDILSKDKAQLHGASLLKIPDFLKWATFGIEYHHIHHLSPRIPSYNLQRCHEDGGNLFYKTPEIGYEQSFKSLFHVLYDEDIDRYISFPTHKNLGLEY